MSHLYRAFCGCLVVLAGATAGCGGDGARPFGGGATGGDTTGSGGGTAGATGSGGNPGTGGGVGTGGVIGGTGGSGPATGGTVGTGGQVASGGVTGSGGLATGGHGGTAGVGGRGGAGGIGGGVATGGRPGTGGGGGGGTGGVNPATCDTIAAAYTAEMPKAKMCADQAGVTPCSYKVSAGLGCQSTCSTYVHASARLNEIAAQWRTANCDSIIRACPAIACPLVDGAKCVASAGSTSSMCMDVSGSATGA